MFHYHETSAKDESHVAHLETPKKHLWPADLDGHAKSAQEIALPELVHSETPQDVVHSEVSKKEDNNENFVVSFGTPGRVVQAFTLLHESPEAQVCLSGLLGQMPTAQHTGCSSSVILSDLRGTWDLILFMRFIIYCERRD